MKKIAIFDLDGTLLNTLESIAYCGNTMLKKYGYKPLDINIYPNFIGHGANALLKSLTEYVGVDQNLLDDFKADYLDFYKENGSYGVKPYDGILELLKNLKENGIKLGILSNKPDKIVKDCVKSYFPDTFDAVYGQKDGVPIKPDTTQLFEILAKFGFTSDDCIYCGDSGVDIDTGKNANVLTLGAAWGFYGNKPFENADGSINHPEELLKYI